MCAIVCGGVLNNPLMLQTKHGRSVNNSNSIINYKFTLVIT